MEHPIEGTGVLPMSCQPRLHITVSINAGQAIEDGPHGINVGYARAAVGIAHHRGQPLDGNP